jgi:hypothetical protein
VEKWVALPDSTKTVGATIGADCRRYFFMAVALAEAKPSGNRTSMAGNRLPHLVIHRTSFPRYYEPFVDPGILRLDPSIPEEINRLVSASPIDGLVLG